LQRGAIQHTHFLVLRVENPDTENEEAGVLLLCDSILLLQLRMSLEFVFSSVVL
jgi:hypothetical protein